MLKITENNLNTIKTRPIIFKKNFQQRETLNEHNFSHKIRILPTKQKNSAKENNFSEKDTTTNQHFIIEKEINTNTNNTRPNKINNNNLVSTEDHQ